VPVAIEFVRGVVCTWDVAVLVGDESAAVENPQPVTNDSRFEASWLSKGCMQVAHESRAFAPPGCRIGQKHCSVVQSCASIAAVRTKEH